MIANELNIGLELTFLPKRRGKWQEFLTFGAATEAADALRVMLQKNKGECNLVVKADPFRVGYGIPEQPHESWCVEINNKPLRAGDITAQGTEVNNELRYLFESAAALRLYPFISKKKADGTVFEWPTGGGHIHVGMDMGSQSAGYLLLLWWIERNICVDFVNYPFIRWLFSQWFDDVNSELPYPLERIPVEPMSIKKRIDQIHQAALCCSSIKQRFAFTGKDTYPTWEFRFFDMPRTVDELALQVRFVTRWFAYYWTTAENAKTLTPRYTLTPDYFKRLTKDMRFARAECEQFFSKIGLDFADYTDVFFERNYITRMKFGKAV